MGGAAAAVIGRLQTLTTPQGTRAFVPKQGTLAGIRLASSRLTFGACSDRRNLFFRPLRRVMNEGGTEVESHLSHARRERAVLTNRPADASWVLRPAASISAAIVLSLITFASAYPETVVDPSCVGATKSFNCTTQWGDPYVRQVPAAVGEAEQARLSARDRKWLARCRPVIERDRYGVARYSYAAAGCEFGVGTD